MRQMVFAIIVLMVLTGCSSPRKDGREESSGVPMAKRITMKAIATYRNCKEQQGFKFMVGDSVTQVQIFADYLIQVSGITIRSIMFILPSGAHGAKDLAEDRCNSAATLEANREKEEILKRQILIGQKDVEYLVAGPIYPKYRIVIRNKIKGFEYKLDEE